MFEVLWLCVLAIVAYYGYSKSPTIRLWVDKLIAMIKSAIVSKTPETTAPVEEVPAPEAPAPVEETPAPEATAPVEETSETTPPEA